jgi:cell division protein FtsQ
LLANIKLVNRLTYLIGVVSVVVLFISLGIYITDRWFCIERITISGDLLHTDQLQLDYIAKHRLKGTFFTLNINNVQEKFSQIPWVKSVVVKRVFPDALNIKITEYTPLARFNDDKFLSDEGQIFSGSANQNLNLPIVYGKDQQIPEIIKLYDNLKPFFASGPVKLSKLYYIGPGLTQMYLSNNLDVVVCGTEVAARLGVLLTYLPRLYQILPKISYVNMCYKDALAISQTDNGLTFEKKEGR